VVAKKDEMGKADKRRKDRKEADGKKGLSQETSTRLQDEIWKEDKMKIEEKYTKLTQFIFNAKAKFGTFEALEKHVMSDGASPEASSSSPRVITDVATLQKLINLNITNQHQSSLMAISDNVTKKIDDITELAIEKMINDDENAQGQCLTDLAVEKMIQDDKNGIGECLTEKVVEKMIGDDDGSLRDEARQKMIDDMTSEEEKEDDEKEKEEEEDQEEEEDDEKEEEEDQEEEEDHKASIARGGRPQDSVGRVGPVGDKVEIVAGLLKGEVGKIVKVGATEDERDYLQNIRGWKWGWTSALHVQFEGGQFDGTVDYCQSDEVKVIKAAADSEESVPSKKPRKSE